MLEIDDTEIYSIETGETIGELENLNREQLKELLEGKKNDQDYT